MIFGSSPPMIPLEQDHVCTTYSGYSQGSTIKTRAHNLSAINPAFASVTTQNQPRSKTTLVCSQLVACRPAVVDKVIGISIRVSFSLPRDHIVPSRPRIVHEIVGVRILSLEGCISGRPRIVD